VAGGGFFASDKGGGGFPAIEAGIYVGVLAALYDLGTQHNETFNKDNRKVVVVWELPDVRIDLEDDDGKPVNLPRQISRRYTLSLNEKAALRKDLEAVRGKAFTKEEAARFNLLGLLGTNAQLQVTNEERDGKTYANIAAMMALPRGTPNRPAETEPEHFTFDEVPAGVPVVFPPNMPEWVQKLAMASPEYAAHNGAPKA
jgi:hypothetical protein